MSDLAGRRILLVEDEVVIAFAVEDMLLELGCVVVGTAHCLEDACQLAESQKIDAAILDVNLNDGRSYPVADALEQRGIPFVFATGYGSCGVHWGDGTVPILAKPYRRDEIVAALTRLLK